MDINTQQMKKDLQKLAKTLRSRKETWCQCCMSEKQIAKQTCTLNFYEKKSEDEMNKIILSDAVHEFRVKYGHILTSVETNALNQTLIRFSWEV